MTTVDVYHEKLNDLVNVINKIQLQPFIKSVEIIENGSVSLDFIHQKTIQVLSTENACYLPAHDFFLEHLVEDAENLNASMLEYLDRRFEALNFRMCLMTELMSGFPVAYFITISDGIVLGFLVKMESE